MPADVNTWGIADAKAHLSEIIERAVAAGPQVITRKGRKAAILVAADEWERKTKRKGSLAQFFASSPLPGSDLTVGRIDDGPRDIEL